MQNIIKIKNICKNTITVNLVGEEINIFSDTNINYIKKRFSKKQITDHHDIPFFSIWFIGKEKNLQMFKCKDNYSSTRANDFAKGYYVTNHYGPPSKLFIEHNEIFILGGDFETILWSYIVKIILLKKSIFENGSFIKASAIMYKNKATLFVGNGGSGKTVLVSNLCKNRDIKLICNSNAIIRNNKIIGLGSALRIRSVENYPLFDSDDSKLIDPDDYFETKFNTFIDIKNIVIFNYKKEIQSTIQKIGVDTCYSLMQEFALGLNVYRLEEDILDSCNTPIEAAKIFRQQSQELLNTIKHAKNYYMCLNIFNDEDVKKIYEIL